MRELTDKLSAFIVLARMIDEKDGFAGRHCENVACLMLKLAKKLALSREEARCAYLSGMLHDIGKIGIPASILQKPAKLTEKEFFVIRFHPDIGADMLAGVSGFEKVAEAVRYHHERYDGNGYPHGIKGKNIPLLSRMLAVCDAYDAMTNRRCYRQPLTEEEALAELARESDRQFDGEISQVFIRLLADIRLAEMQSNRPWFYQSR